MKTEAAEGDMAARSRNRGKRKLKLRDLSRIQPTREEWNELSDEFIKIHPPVVTAILGQSLIEIILDSLLRSHFSRRDDDTWAALTDEPGPLSTFHRKITIGYAFGIYNEIIRDNLNTIRSIRNAFAHSKKPIDFAHDLILRELQKISLPLGTKSSFYRSLSIARRSAESVAEGPNEILGTASYIILCSAVENQLLEKLLKRAKTAQRRKRTSLFRRQLTQALLGSDQPEEAITKLRNTLENEIENRHRSQKNHFS